MTDLKHVTVCITGASSGIGAACARAFAREGSSLLLAARRVGRLDAFAAQLHADHGIRTLTLELDVRDRSAVEKAYASLPGTWKQIGILVNNAGLARGFSKVHEGSYQDWDEMIDTNVKGLLTVTRTVLPDMVARGSGQIINIGSIAGREVYPNGNVYCASKYAVRAITRGLKLDLLGTGVRVCTVDPGLVETEFSLVRFHGDEERAAKPYAGTRPLRPEDVAQVVLFCAQRPSHVDITEVVVMPTDQASATHVHRTT